MALKDARKRFGHPYCRLQGHYKMTLGLERLISLLWRDGWNQCLMSRSFYDQSIDHFVTSYTKLMFFAAR